MSVGACFMALRMMKDSGVYHNNKSPTPLWKIVLIILALTVIIFLYILFLYYLFK